METLRLTVLFLFVLLALFDGMAAAEKQKVISDKNEYGGKTVEVTYESGDKLYGGAVKKIVYYDSNGKETKEEYFCTDKFAQENGVNRKIAFFDSDGKITKTELFYTDKFADEKGYNRLTADFYNNEKVAREELFYADKFANEKGVSRSVTYFNNNNENLGKR